ncbi:mitochondrial omega-amidase [Schizosaccharomyces pombe]|uniref:Probable nitrilase C965.09 n=1 Tax=Schizosaccharomyces pombe (strain 972 / ATCC 24843) TaxID=284812 RepID=YCU9_SCHPO|nr:putative omega-amidase-like protein [Schizosaccharomyces pombe]O59829.1 RecName: Full=Probable nitrilase C965.09 [Schizosaccharomyces pombe 972h-]CAA19069.1 nitrilase family protein, omega-amidase related (predicted) [Schizosaccharomyces pombe]|eukprot:NP_588519.1 putative omega-amidase-like protein [Schizosaccharomyces pombe]
MKANIACVQMAPKVCDVKHNLQKMSSYVHEVMESNPSTNLILFPELITSGYECGNTFTQIAEIAGEGPSFKTMSNLAAKYHVNIIYGFPEKEEKQSNIIYNSCIYITENGNLGGVYRKVHLFDTERKHFKKGSDFPIFETSFGKLGVMICWDTAFPEVARIHALNGADLLVVATNWENPYSDDWDLVTKARAFENCIPLVAANRVGTDEKLSFFGHSKIIGPTGKVIKALDEEKEGVISYTVDLDDAKPLRKNYYTFFEDRMPDLYKRLLSP